MITKLDQVTAARVKQIISAVLHPNFAAQISIQYDARLNVFLITGCPRRFRREASRALDNALPAIFGWQFLEKGVFGI